MRSRSLRQLASVAAIAAFVSACDLVPGFNNTPEISFREIRQSVTTDELGNAVVALTISINFKDGDGDLGLDTNEAPGQFNYFITPYKKLNGEFVRARLPNDTSFAFDGRFMRLTEDDRKKPIEGELDYDINFFASLFPGDEYIFPGDTLKFDIQIADRARNLSNKIPTAEVVLSTL